jgi:diguanylate cyclase (GGDEF)-like protein
VKLRSAPKQSTVIEEQSRMTEAVAGEETVFLSNVRAGRKECRFACAIIAVSTVIFLLLAPFAKMPLQPVAAFIPIYQSALLINDLITAVFLLGQRHVSRANALCLLAGGYLFSALMSAAHALTFPGLFSPTGLLHAGPQTTAWLYMFWHGGFPLFVIAYVLYEPHDRTSRRDWVVPLVAAASVAAAVCCVTLLATWGQGALPAIMQADHHAPEMIVVVSSVWLLNLLALFVLSRRRPYSVLDLWLLVVLCAWLFDIALSVMFNAGRYDLGFYAGRIYGLLAASFVLIVLLFENGKLHVQLHTLRESDRAKAAELRRLSTIDPLTAIANRRAFEEALDVEWRRMLRQGTPLSLLMIDVDYFKRFNDSYGHVAGDECLKAVAQALAGRARRAGEVAARYGGEEFAVLLPGSDTAAASKLAALICETVRERRIPHEGSAVAPYVTISVGVASVAEVPKYAATLSREGAAAAAMAAGATVLVETADHALYRAKTSGRNRFFTAGSEDDSIESATRATARQIPSAA